MMHGTMRLACLFATPFFLVGCGDEPDLQRSVPQDLVPADAVVYIEIESLDAIDEMGAMLSRNFGRDVDFRAEFDAFLMRSLGESVDVGRIDAARPVGVALDVESAIGGPPGGALLIPVDDASGFVDSAQQPEGATEPVSQGGYVAVPMSSTYRRGTSANGMASDLPAGEIAARIDVESLLAKYRPMIDAGMDQLGAMYSGPAFQSLAAGVDIGAVMEMYFSAFRAVMDSATRLDLVVDVEGSQLDLRMALEVREGSLLAGFAEGSTNELREVAGYVDPSEPFVFFMGMDMGQVWEEFKPLMDQVLRIYPADMQEVMAPTWSIIEDMYRQMGSGLAGTLDFHQDGMRAAYYMSSDDPDRVIAQYVAMCKSDALAPMGMKPGESRAVRMEGLDVTQVNVAIDYDAMFAALGATGDDTALDTDALTEMTKKTYGPNGLRLALASKDGVVAMVMGGDEAYIQRSIAALASGPSSLSPGVERMVANVDRARAAFATRMDLGKMASIGADLFQSMEGTASPMPDLAGQSLTVEGYGAIEGRVWRGGVRLDLAEIGKLMSALGDG